MQRTAHLESILFGNAAENRVGALERLNNAERIANGINARLNWVAAGVLATVGASFMSLVVGRHNAVQIDALPQKVPAITLPADPSK